MRERLAELGFADFVAYVAWCCERALERGLLPHTNLGALGRDDLARLREVTASQGLMLESLRPDLVAHQASPTKDPALRLATLRAAEELRIPCTSGILVGIGETEADRMAALEALAGFEHLQEVILQNFVPAPPLLRRGAGRDRHRGGRGVLAHRPARRTRRFRAGVVVAGDRRGHGAARRRGAAAHAATSASRSRRTWPTGGRGWSRRAPPTSAG